MEFIFSVGFVLGLLGLLVIAGIIVLFIYRVAKRADEKQREDFEKRDH